MYLRYFLHVLLIYKKKSTSKFKIFFHIVNLRKKSTGKFRISSFISLFALQHAGSTTAIHAISAAHLPGAAGTILPGRRFSAGSPGLPLPSGVGSHRCVLPHVRLHAAYSH
jgi:hypothetical protein